jgi:hypothetical protein
MAVIAHQAPTVPLEERRGPLLIVILDSIALTTL